MKGVVNIACHVKEDLSKANLSLLNIYASNDKIIKPSEYSNYKHNFPVVHELEIIDGGVHGYFGDYGLSKLDGIPTISRETQISQTAKAIAKFVS